jgi:AraC-like DNA-binding protein
MKAHFEKVTPGSASLMAFERVDFEFPFYWHYHPEFELTLIVESQGQRLVGDGIGDYGPGDLVLLGSNLPHSYRSGPVKTATPTCHRAIVIQFREDCLGPQFFHLPEMQPIQRLLQRSACGLSFGNSRASREAAARMMKFLTCSPAQRIVELLGILVLLASEPNPAALSTDRVRPMCRVEDQQRIDAICAHFSEHFDEEINYTKLANKLHTDQASLCRFFKRATGRTMTAYVNELRVGAAAQLLTTTDLSVLDIAFRVGFGNYSNFNRQFKRIKGYGPRTLRRHFSSQSEPEFDMAPQAENGELRI